MAEALSIAIAGAGLMGRWHAQYARHCGVRVAGILDRNAGAAEQLAAKFPGALAWTDLNDLLKHSRFDAIHVCTPVESHARIAEEALAAGGNVLLEKPLAPDAATVRDLLSQADRRGLMLAPTHQFLFQRGFLLAQKALPGMGRVLHLDATFCSAGGGIVGPDRLDEIAAEILPHPLSLMERLLPGRLEATNWSVFRTSEGEWRISGANSAVSISILISLQGRPTEASFRILTDGGSIDLDLFHGFATIDTATVSRSTKAAKPFRTAAGRFIAAGTNLMRRLATREFAYPGLRTLISVFYDAIRRGGPSPVTACETLAVAVARDALLESAGFERQQGAV
jgi:predicted dehydrogenase